MYFSPIQTATYTITAHAMSQLMAISNAAMREKALNYVQEIALKHSGTTRVIMNNISGIIANFKAKNATTGKIGWIGYCTITILGVGTVYIVYKARFPNASITTQRGIIDDLERGQARQEEAQGNLKNEVGTGQRLVENAQEVANQDGRLIDRVEGNLQQVDEATALLIAELQEIKAALDGLPALQEQEAILDEQKTLIQSLKGRCENIEKRFENRTQEAAEEETKLTSIIAEFKQLKAQVLKRGQDGNKGK